MRSAALFTHVLTITLANNGEHYLYFASLASAQASSTLWIMANRFSVQTDVNMYQGLDFSDNDARIYDYLYGSNGFWAWTICPTGSAKGGVDPDRWCRPQEVRYNLTYYAEAYNTEAKRRYVACHELGHTVGLREAGSTADCMWAWSVVTYNLSADHISHINAQY